jgi:DNA polymerase-3 subunit gamma/tau
MARILAKALNCSTADGPTPTPCCKCESCLAVARGEDVDVVEIDAASNTGVDNIRELRSNATLRPARSRFKIYIIDEVHMLSTGAFNALLKTLEEPPPHVKFILATTEAHKVPATIQSRCQRFDFRAIDVEGIAKHLARIVKEEGIKAEEGVLRRIARLANGSMRDALSLLDKLLSYDATLLTRDVVDQVIPPPHDELSMAVVDRIAAADPGGALSALDAALQTGRTVDRFSDHLIEHMRTLMLISVCGADTDLVDVPPNVRTELAEQAKRFDAPTYVYMISLLEELRRNVKSSGAARALADAAIVRLAMSHKFTDLETLLDRLDDGAPAAPAAKPSAAPRASIQSPPPLEAKKKEPDLSMTAAATGRDPDVTSIRRASAANVAAPVVESASRTAPNQEFATPEQQQAAMRDPLVMLVKEMVDGTIVNVRAARPRPPMPREAPAETGDAQEELTPTEK